MIRCLFCSSLPPGGVHRYVLVTRRRQDTHQLVQDGRQEVNHHVTLYSVETLTKREGENVLRNFLKNLSVIFVLFSVL